MKFIVNNNIPADARNKLASLGEIITVSSSGITYPEISGHPDIFICQVGNTLVVAPNLPDSIKENLSYITTSIITGNNQVGNSYPNTAFYNAVVTDKFLIHNLEVTDNNIKELCRNKIHIHVKQAYTRCNLLPLKNDRFITSDKGIMLALQNYDMEVLYVSPNQIILPGFNNGFIGGACGIYNNKVFIIGKLSNYNYGNDIQSFLEKENYNIIELYDGRLFDGGSILVL